jgi:RNA polymerase sigma-70 factor (ECF subfamily)
VPPDFRALFEQEFGYVSNTLRRLGVAESERDDVAHEVFLRVHERFGEYDPSRPLRPWIFAFAFRCAAEHRRLARHRLELVGLPADPVDPQPPPDEVAAVQDERDLVTRALDCVAMERRAVLLLHDVEGASAPEISEVLGIPLNTVYSRLRVARQELSVAVRRLQGQQGSGSELNPVMLLPALFGAGADGAAAARRGWIAMLFAAHPVASAAAALAVGVAVGATGYATLVRTERAAPEVRTVYVEREPARAASSPAASAAEAVAAAAPASATSALASSKAPPAVACTPAVAAPASATAPSFVADRDGSLAAEQRLLDQARSALSQGDPSAAGALLERHARVFPHALLVEEREALSIEVLAASGQLDDARAAIERFRSRYPNSLFTSALRSAAGGP